MAQAFSGQAALLLEIPASPMPQTVASQHPCKGKKQKHKIVINTYSQCVQVLGGRLTIKG
jgi:hypothetical protein